jgi:predicted GIY-YIG superfamily endonuclease
VWFVYVLVSPAGRTYVGVTTDVDRRLRQHNGEVRGGARSTRAGRPWQVGRVLGPVRTRGRALSVEYQVKQLDGRRRLTAPVSLRRRKKLVVA